MNKIAGRKKKGKTKILAAQVGKILARYKMGKFVEWEIVKGRLTWHLQQRLKPLFEADGKGKNRQWILENVLERLKGIRKDRVHQPKAL